MEIYSGYLSVISSLIEALMGFTREPKPASGKLLTTPYFPLRLANLSLERNQIFFAPFLHFIRQQTTSKLAKDNLVEADFQEILIIFWMVIGPRGGGLLDD